LIGFAVRFENLTPNPGTPFTIEIKGLRYLDEIIPIPKVRYKDKKAWRYERAG